MPTWPGGLPTKPLVDGYEEAAPQDHYRSSIDGLPMVQRQKTRATVRPLNISMDMTNAQVNTFQSFFRTDLGYGAIPFDFTHPRTGATVSLRCVGGQPPRLSAIGYDLYRYIVTAEVLP